MINKIGLQALKIYVSGENLLTFSPLKKYAKNYDPEGIYAGTPTTAPTSSAATTSATATVIPS